MTYDPHSFTSRADLGAFVIVAVVFSPVWIPVCCLGCVCWGIGLIAEKIASAFGAEL